jgi:hypothetical protein
MILSFSFIQTWFTQGALHPLLTASHIILLLSIAVLIGQQGLKLWQLILSAFAMIAGFFINQTVTLGIIESFNIELILSAFALTISLLVIFKLRLPVILVAILIFISILVVAYDSEPIVIPGVGDNSINNWLVGAFISILGFVTSIALLASFFKRFWSGIILRVLGSWIATSTIFIITLSFATLNKG